MNKKVVIFDFDGTLTKSPKGSNCWVKVWQAINDSETDNMLYDRYNKGEIDEKEWIHLIFLRWKEKGVNQLIMEQVADKIELLFGAQETLKKLYDSGIKIYILSGGIRQIIEKVLQREGADIYIKYIETYDLIFNEKGNLTGYKFPELNPEKKNEFVSHVLSKNKIKPDEAFFIGNGANDETVYKTGVPTLCINPDDAHYNNKLLWTNCIKNCKNLSEILPFIINIKNDN